MLASLPAAAQQKSPDRDPFAKQPNVERFLHPEPPKFVNPIDKDIRDAIRKLGLGKQPNPLGNDDAKAPEPAPGLSAEVLPKLDGNRDGYLSEKEYIGGRIPAPTAGVGNPRRRVEEYRRYGARFRAADRNGDGRLSPSEIDAMQGKPF